MGLYIITLVAFFSTVSSFVMMLAAKPKPPERWNDWVYSKSKFALWLNEKRDESKFLGPLRIDRFRLSGTIISFTLFIISCAALIVDTVLDQAIYVFLGELAIIIIALLALLAPFIYEASLTIWWSIVERSSLTKSQINKLVRIKKKNKKVEEKINKEKNK